MNQEKWRQTYVCLPDQSILSVYNFYSQGHGISDDREHGEDVHNEVVLMIAGCGNTVSVYTMLGNKSLPDYLFSNNFDVILI